MRERPKKTPEELAREEAIRRWVAGPRPGRLDEAQREADEASFRAHVMDPIVEGLR